MCCRGVRRGDRIGRDINSGVIKCVGRVIDSRVGSDVGDEVESGDDG